MNRNTLTAITAIAVVLIAISTSILYSKGFEYYTDCIKTLDVRGYHNVFDPYASRSCAYLYIVAATIRDDGESNKNFISPTADIGLHVYGGKHFEVKLNSVRLFGPNYEGIDDNDGTLKYEWSDYCSMHYNNFAIMQVSGYKYNSVRIQAIEGDDQPGNPDDIVFDAIVWLDQISRGNNVITGNCDIPGKCATFWFAIRDCISFPNAGHFWDSSERSSVRPLPRPVHPAVEPLAKGAELFVRGAETIKWIAQKAWGLGGIWPHNWAVIEYADGYCIFNRFRAKRTIEDVIAHARGEGDCDWWEWPESARKHVCLRSYPEAFRLAQVHRGIRDIRWIDHPTARCGY